MGLGSGSSDCSLCEWDPETAQNILLDFEALDARKKTLLGVPMAESDDFRTIHTRPFDFGKEVYLTTDIDMLDARTAKG